MFVRLLIYEQSLCFPNIYLRFLYRTQVISVESEYEVGSTFYFSMPINKLLAVKTVTTEKKPSRSIPDLKNISILVAEDDYSNYSYLKILLQKTGANVIHAENGEQAVHYYLNNPSVRLILMDIKMPVMNGIQAYKEIRLSGSKVPIVAQTAYALADELNKLKEVGFNEYLTKPINPKDLYVVLNKLIA